MKQLSAQPMIDWGDILESVIDGSTLQHRLETHSENVFSIVQSEFDRIDVDAEVSKIAADVELAIADFVTHEEVASYGFYTDERNLRVFGAALLIALRERNIPITSGEMAEMISTVTSPSKIVEDASEKSLRVEYHSDEDNVELIANGRSHKFRVLSDDEQSVAAKNEIDDLFGSQGRMTTPVGVEDLIGRLAVPKIRKKHINAAKLQLDSVNGELTTAPDPEYFIDRYASVIDLHPETQQLAKDIIVEFDQGRSANMIAAAAVWIGTQLSGEPVRQSEIKSEAGVSGAGLRKAVQDVDVEFTTNTVRLSETPAAGGVMSVPSCIIEWLDVDDPYIRYPYELFGAEEGQQIQIPLTETLPDDSDRATRREVRKYWPEMVNTSRNESSDSHSGVSNNPPTMWTKADSIPIPDQSDAVLPSNINWGCVDKEMNEVTLTIR